MSKDKEHLMSAIEKGVVKSAENKLIMNKWGNMPYNVLGVQHTTRDF